MSISFFKWLKHKNWFLKIGQTWDKLVLKTPRLHQDQANNNYILDIIPKNISFQEYLHYFYTKGEYNVATLIAWAAYDSF